MTTTLNIDLWFWRLEASAGQLERWSRMLSADETARASRFVFEIDRTRFTICRSRLRRILGWYTATLPRDVSFATTGRNKPVLGGPNPNNVQFNLTHTKGLAGLAVVEREPVGFDLEFVRDIKDDFIAHTLNPAEQPAVMPLAPAERRSAFFRVWTAKEAYLKGTGAGLFQPLGSFDVTVPSPAGIGDFHPAALTRNDDLDERRRNWRLFTFAPTTDHCGALAIAPPQGANLAIRTRWLGQ